MGNTAIKIVAMSIFWGIIALASLILGAGFHFFPVLTGIFCLLVLIGMSFSVISNFVNALDVFKE